MIKIKDNYYVKVSELNYTAIEKRKGVNKKGEEIDSLKTIGYYSNLTSAIKGIRDYVIDNQLDTEEDIKLEDAIKVIKKITEEFKVVLERHMTNE